MSIDEPLRYRLQSAAQPTTADVLKAKIEILRLLSSGTEIELSAIRAQVLASLNLPGAADELIQVRPLQEHPDAATESDLPALKHTRASAGIDEAIAELQAAGLLEAMTWQHQDQTQLNVGDWQEHGGWRGGTRIHVPKPQLAEAYRLSPLHSDRADLYLLDGQLASSGLTTLLGPRGTRCLDEAIHAFRQGLYLAASNLVGAASESAWYQVGEALRDQDQIAKAIDSEIIGQVIKKVLLNDELDDDRAVG